MLEIHPKFNLQWHFSLRWKNATGFWMTTVLHHRNTCTLTLDSGAQLLDASWLRSLNCQDGKQPKVSSIPTTLYTLYLSINLWYGIVWLTVEQIYLQATQKFNWSIFSSLKFDFFFKGYFKTHSSTYLCYKLILQTKHLKTQCEVYNDCIHKNITCLHMVCPEVLLFLLLIL